MTDHPDKFDKSHDQDQVAKRNEAHTQRKLPEEAVSDLESPEPGTHTIDKVITPVSNKKLDSQVHELNRTLDEVEKKLDK
ncbi:hypothetical protein ACFQDN_19780 [Pseudomonas asuensis]|uniref:Uncharacterized protein n=1 Tax=Pseudomonas asuensis TaxID=1825787 RepID=A0ABQ2GFY3_9PSED|nr:hypothetical protein [Pseudomonas asuensis]GGL94534.1 hypothetical protein GCM10009425_01870 [Pseudomonas asuensis]